MAVFLIFTLFDTAFRGDLMNVDDQTIADQERQEALLRAREPGLAAPAPTDTSETAPADTTQAAPADTSAAGEPGE